LKLEFGILTKTAESAFVEEGVSFDLPDELVNGKEAVREIDLTMRIEFRKMMQSSKEKAETHFPWRQA